MKDYTGREGVEALRRFRTFESTPERFNPNTASDAALRKYGIPRRPDPKRETHLSSLWKRAFSRPTRFVRAELQIDRVMSHRDPLARNRLGSGGEHPAFGPSGWAGVVVTNASLGLATPEPTNTVFGQFTVPGIFPASDPNMPITVGFWVGLDGYGNNQVLQAGIAATVNPNATVTWWAWTEWYTTKFQDPAVQIMNFPVNVGDLISVLVCAPRSDHGFVSMLNVSTGQATSVGIDARPGITSAGASAEWIVEGVSPKLPVFFPMVIGSCSAGTKHTSFNLKPAGITTNIIGNAGLLTNSSIASATTAVIDWKGWA